jgi:hypothetical protein
VKPHLRLNPLRVFCSRSAILEAVIGSSRTDRVAGRSVPASMPRVSFTVTLNAALWQPTPYENSRRAACAVEMRGLHLVDRGFRGRMAPEYSMSRLVLGITTRELCKVQRPAFSSCWKSRLTVSRRIPINAAMLPMLTGSS